ncbi:DEAD box helicase, putative, partial [Plasmodium ovale curtisi]
DLLLKYFTSINEPVSNITRFMLLSKLDALNLNNISSFLNNSLFCRRFKVFAEININEYFKKTNTERPSIIATYVNSSSIYLLCEFTNKLIRSNKYDYVYINQNDDSGLDNNPDLEDDHLYDKQAGKTNEIKNANNNSNTATLSHAYPNKRHGHGTSNNVEAEKKRKIQETNTHQEDNINKESELNKEDHNITHFSELSEYIKYVLENSDITLKEKIEIISVSSCNNFQSITKDCNNVILIGETNNNDNEPKEREINLDDNKDNIEEKKESSSFFSKYYSKFVSTSKNEQNTNDNPKDNDTTSNHENKENTDHTFNKDNSINNNNESNENEYISKDINLDGKNISEDKSKKKKKKVINSEELIIDSKRKKNENIIDYYKIDDKSEIDLLKSSQENNSIHEKEDDLTGSGGIHDNDSTSWSNKYSEHEISLKRKQQIDICNEILGHLQSKYYEQILNIEN